MADKMHPFALSDEHEQRNKSGCFLYCQYCQNSACFLLKSLRRHIKVEQYVPVREWNVNIMPRYIREEVPVVSYDNDD